MKSSDEQDGSSTDGMLLKKISLGSPFQDGSKIFKTLHTLLRSKKKEQRHSPTFETNENYDGCSIPNTPNSPITYKQGSRSPMLELSLWPPTKKSGNSNSTNHQISPFDQGLPLHEITNEMNKSPTNLIFHKNTGGNEDIFLDHMHMLRINSPKTSPTASHFKQESEIVSEDITKKDKRIGKITRNTSFNRSISVQSVSKEQYKKQLRKAQTKSSPKKTKKYLYNSRLHESNIPYFFKKENDDCDQFPRITSETLHDIIENNIQEPTYSSVHVIDCRFKYEFDGGHIKVAKRLSTKDDIEWCFFSEEGLLELSKGPILVVFHCEFSCYRSPTLASHLRICDRILNSNHYPKLNYSDIVILDGGYKHFYENYPSLCDPDKYVSMNSEKNEVNCDQELYKFKNDSKKLVSRNNSLYRLNSISRSSINLKHTISQKAQQESVSLPNKKPISNLALFDVPPKKLFAQYEDDSSIGSVDITLSNDSPSFDLNSVQSINSVSKDQSNDTIDQSRIDNLENKIENPFMVSSRVQEKQSSSIFFCASSNGKIQLP